MPGTLTPPDFRSLFGLSPMNADMELTELAELAESGSWAGGWGMNADKS